MKLAEFHGHSLKIKRPEIINKGNDKIVYLGTDAIQQPHSGPQATPRPVTAVPTLKRVMSAKSAGKLNFKQWNKIWSKEIGQKSGEGGQKGGETLWLDNPSVTGCPTCGY